MGAIPMLVEVSDQVQARRLELDGYSRTGSKAVEAQFSDLNNILDRDDVSVSKVSLHRRNGDDEAEIINREIREHSGKVNMEYISSPYSASPGKNPFKVRSRGLFEVSEDSMTIYRDFQEVVSGDYDLRRVDGFEEEREELLEEIDETIAEWQSYRERVENIKPSDVFEG